MNTIRIMSPACWTQLVALAVVLATAGCGGSDTPGPATPNTSAVPRIAPPAPRPDPTPEPIEPEKPLVEAPAKRRPVGAWLFWSVAGSDEIEDKAHLRFTVTSSGSVLQLANYDAPRHEHFPSLYLRSIVSARSLDELVAKSLPAQLYIMAEKDTHMLHNRPGQAVTITITEIDGRNVRGTFAGEVHDVQLGGNGPVAGEFQAIVDRSSAWLAPDHVALQDAQMVASHSLRGVLSALVSAAALPVQDAKTEPAAPLANIRPANQPIAEEAQSLLARVKSATEKLTVRSTKPEELRGRSEPLRREIVEQYRALHRARELGDEILLRGELDGFAIRQQADELEPPLAKVVAELRPHLGSEQGLSNAMTRRAKEQGASLRQLDDLIEQKASVVENKWTRAYARYNELQEAADEFGRFVDAAEAEPLFKPLAERAARIRPGYFDERKQQLKPSLLNEFAQLRPNLDALREKFIAVERDLSDGKALEWEGKPVTGPAILNLWIELWQQVERQVAQAAAVVHAIGSDADLQRKLLQTDYEAVRVAAITLTRDVIRSEPESLSAAELEVRYTQYLEIVPRFLAAFNEPTDSFRPAGLALEELASRSDELKNRIDQYRSATDEALRWRRRLAHAYLTNWRKNTAEPLAKLLDAPPALPGQEGPGGLKRTNQNFWSLDQPPNAVDSAWREQWKDLPVRWDNALVVWPTGADPRFTSTWHHRIAAESQLPRTKVVDLVQTLSGDLLATSTRPPWTLETAMAIHSASFGPYVEVQGKIKGASAHNLIDRLWDRPERGDLAGALAADSLSPHPRWPALVRLEIEADWIAHDLFVWSLTPAPDASPSPPSPKAQPLARDNLRAPQDAGKSEMPKEQTAAAAQAPVSAAQPTSAPQSAGTTGAPELPQNSEAAQPAAAPRRPPGGVPF